MTRGKVMSPQRLFYPFSQREVQPLKSMAVRSDGLMVGSERKSCAGTDRQHSGGLSILTDSRGCDQFIKQRNIPSPF